MTTPTPAPWDSPQVVTPKEMSEIIAHAPEFRPREGKTQIWKLELPVDFVAFPW